MVHSNTAYRLSRMREYENAIDSSIMFKIGFYQMTASRFRRQHVLQDVADLIFGVTWQWLAQTNGLIRPSGSSKDVMLPYGLL